MNVAGIDISTFSVDIVLVPLDDGDWLSGAKQPVWHRFELEGADAFERTRTVADVVPGRASRFWDDVLAVGIEEPAGRNPGFAFRVQGAVLACIPGRLLVEKWMPSQWRKAVGLAGNATKAEVAYWSDDERGRGTHDWTQDAHDAHCIALATRGALTSQAAA